MEEQRRGALRVGVTGQPWLGSAGPERAGCPSAGVKPANVQKWGVGTAELVCACACLVCMSTWLVSTRMCWLRVSVQLGLYKKVADICVVTWLVCVACGWCCHVRTLRVCLCIHYVRVYGWCFSVCPAHVRFSWRVDMRAVCRSLTGSGRSGREGELTRLRRAGSQGQVTLGSCGRRDR